MKRCSRGLPGPIRDCGQRTGHVIVEKQNPTQARPPGQRPHICQRMANMDHGITGPPARIFLCWLAGRYGMDLQIQLKAAESERKRERAGIGGPVTSIEED
jgi:hypothetical protein